MSACLCCVRNAALNGLFFRPFTDLPAFDPVDLATRPFLGAAAFFRAAFAGLRLPLPAAFAAGAAAKKGRFGRRAR